MSFKIFLRNPRVSTFLFQCNFFHHSSVFCLSTKKHELVLLQSIFCYLAHYYRVHRKYKRRYSSYYLSVSDKCGFWSMPQSIIKMQRGNLKHWASNQVLTCNEWLNFKIISLLEFFNCPRCQFHQHSTSSFYLRRSQKCKKAAWLDCLFAFLGFSCVKAACRMLVKLTWCIFGCWINSGNISNVQM